MNGMMCFLFAEYIASPDASLPSAECAKYAKMCETNFIAGLQDYECLVTPTLENIQCLMIGVSCILALVHQLLKTYRL